MLNLKGKLARSVNTWLSIESLQPLYDRLNTLSLLGMNVGSATNYLENNGELHVMKFVKKNCDGRNVAPVIFDVGAHTGGYARELNLVFGKNARLFCFEPSKNLFAELNENTRGYSDSVESYNLGLGDAKSSVTLYDSGNHIPTTLSDAFSILDEKVASTETIEIVRLDEFCAERNIEKIDFLKVDVEGNELKVLQGAGEMINRAQIDFIQFEFGQHCVASKSFFYDFYSLLKHNYELFRVLPNALYKIEKYQTKLEIFVSATNYLAVKKSLS